MGLSETRAVVKLIDSVWSLQWLPTICLLTTFGSISPCRAGEGVSAPRPEAPKMWVTWRGIEADKGASAWFLTRFVRHDVQFREVESGLLDVGKGQPFDIPQAAYRRTHQLSVYEQLERAYPVNDATAKRIGEIIHDMEINLWAPKKFAESALIQKATLDFAEARGDGWIPLRCYVRWFDAIYLRMSQQGDLKSLPEFPSACLVKK